MKSQAVQGSRWVGRVLRDKWRIDGRIARGGMGTVFAATHRNNGSRAAIKVLHPEFSRDEDTKSRFLQEGYAANQVNHPGVVRILDDDVTEEGLAYLVMELLEGELLEQRRIRKGGRLPLVEVYEFADQLLDVLAAAHAKGIVHRDIKPDNVFLTDEGRIKVLDFGFAQMKTGFRREQTATGFLLGTPGFMAPEQASGNRPLIDAQTDIWAVGATMFLLLTGQPVYDADSAAELLVAAANFPARSIATVDPGLPTKLRSLVDRALAYQKRDRWPDARSMQAALRSVPGREPPSEPIRRSLIHDDLGAHAEDATLMEHVEELDDDVLLSGSGETRAMPYVHPADRDGPTIARSEDPRHASARSNRRSSDPPPVEETMLMVGRPVPLPFGRASADGARVGPETPRPSHPDGFHPARLSHPDGLPRAPFASSPHGLLPLPSGDEMMFVAGPARRAADAPRSGSRVLVFVAVAGITMVVVVVTGLLIILGLD